MNTIPVSPAIKKLFDTSSLYDKYFVTILFREKVCGGKPKSDDLLGGHIIRTTGHDDEATKRLIEQAMEGLPPQEGDLEEKVQSSSSRFLSDSIALYLDCYQAKAMLKQSASMLGIFRKRIGTKQVCSEGMEVKGLQHERRLHFQKREPTGNYVYVTAPTGTQEATVHVTTAKGKVSGIKRVDYLEEDDLILSFEVWILKTDTHEKRHVGEKDLVEILRFSQENGLGADRSQGYGKFDVVELRKLS